MAITIGGSSGTSWSGSGTSEGADALAASEAAGGSIQISNSGKSLGMGGLAIARWSRVGLWLNRPMKGFLRREGRLPEPSADASERRLYRGGEGEVSR